MAMPNFLLIGAAKSGTDALCAYLAQHPERLSERQQGTELLRG
jgi:hypothetical protein